MPRSSHKKMSVQEHLRDLEKVEPDFAYWMEHVVHWHAFLFAVIAVLSIGYLLFSKQSVMAG